MNKTSFLGLGLSAGQVIVLAVMAVALMCLTAFGAVVVVRVLVDAPAPQVILPNQNNPPMPTLPPPASPAACAAEAAQAAWRAEVAKSDQAQAEFSESVARAVLGVGIGDVIEFEKRHGFGSNQTVIRVRMKLSGFDVHILDEGGSLVARIHRGKGRRVTKAGDLSFEEEFAFFDVDRSGWVRRPFTIIERAQPDPAGGEARP